MMELSQKYLRLYEWVFVKLHQHIMTQLFPHCCFVVFACPPALFSIICHSYYLTAQQASSFSTRLLHIKKIFLKTIPSTTTTNTTIATILSNVICNDDFCMDLQKRLGLGLYLLPTYCTLTHRTTTKIYWRAC